jgi:glycosyltransferase involved in cell wall biosynthesis
VTMPWDYFKNTPIENQIYWIPDFQCFHLPEYFESEDIRARKKSYLEILSNAKKLVLSSESVHNDLKSLYPNRNYPEIGVLRFAVFNEVKSEYLKPIGFDRPYFICPNQFWAHKNQELILKALKHIGAVNLPFYVVFTGKMFDSRKNNHFRDVIEPFLNDKYVKNNVKLLGFIDRDIQLDLIKRAIALIQPSRFEGWSTVIEDGMSMNLNVLASKLEVNKEQLGNEGQYFDVDDYISLAKIMQQFDFFSIQKTNYQYSEKQLKFATDFLEIIKT